MSPNGTIGRFLIYIAKLKGTNPRGPHLDPPLTTTTTITTIAYIITNTNITTTTIIITITITTITTTTTVIFVVIVVIVAVSAIVLVVVAVLRMLMIFFFFFTSTLKDIAAKTIPKISAVPKRFNKPWFTDTCKDAIKERNKAIGRFKCEPTRDNLDAYCIARAKAHRDIRHSKKTSRRNHVSKMNSQTSVKSV